MTLHGLKLQPIQLLEAVVSSSTSSHTLQYILTFIENNAQLPFPHSTDDQTKGTVTASLHLTFYLKKVVD